MSNDKTRYGLIGAGTIGQAYIRALAEVEGAQLVAIAEPNDVPISWTFETLKTSPFSPTIYSDWYEMLASSDLDAVIVSTPGFTHYPYLIELMRTDIAILVSPPLCTQPDHARQLANLAADRQALTQVGLDYRSLPPVARFIQRIHGGDIGSPGMMTIRVHRSEPPVIVDDWIDPKGEISEILVEAFGQFFDLMRLVVQSEPVRVYASAGTATPDTKDGADAALRDDIDHAYIVLDFANGSRAMFELCLFASTEQPHEEICVTGPLGQLHLQVPAARLTFTPRDCSGSEAVRVEQLAEGADTDPCARAMPLHLQAFQHALVAGEPASASAFEGLRAVEIALAAQQSVASGQAVTL